MPTQYTIDQIKPALASVEQSGNTEGHYAQLTPIVLKDLQMLGKFKGITFDQVLSDPKLYDDVVLAYWDRLADFGIPDDLKTRVLYWYKPSLYKKTGGDINKVADPRDRNIFQNRLKNYAEPTIKKQHSQAGAFPAQRSYAMEEISLNDAEFSRVARMDKALKAFDGQGFTPQELRQVAMKLKAPPQRPTPIPNRPMAPQSMLAQMPQGQMMQQLGMG